MIIFRNMENRRIFNIYDAHTDTAFERIIDY